MSSTPSAGFFFSSTCLLGVLIFTGCASISDSPVAETETASVAPSVSAEITNAIELGDGHLTFDIPESWTAEFEDLTAVFEADDSVPEFNGRSAQRAEISSPHETVHLDVFTNIPWPDVVAVDADEVVLLHAEPLNMGFEPEEDGYGMWLRAVIVENPEMTDPRPTVGTYDGRFEQGRYLLVVAPYLAKAEYGPPDELGGGQTSFRFPFTEETTGAWWEDNITIAAGTINQRAAEELTGAEGLDAMLELVDTEEYAELIDIIRSFRVHVEATAE